MIAVTGAAIVLSRLPGLSAGLSFSLPSVVRTKTIRTGCEFCEVGPHFMISWISRSCASLTGLSRKTLCVRARRRIRSSELASIMYPSPRLADTVTKPSRPVELPGRNLGLHRLERRAYLGEHRVPVAVLGLAEQPRRGIPGRPGTAQRPAPVG